MFERVMGWIVVAGLGLAIFGVAGLFAADAVKDVRRALQRRTLMDAAQDMLVAEQHAIDARARRVLVAETGIWTDQIVLPVEKLTIEQARERYPLFDWADHIEEVRDRG